MNWKKYLYHTILDSICVSVKVFVEVRTFCCPRILRNLNDDKNQTSTKTNRVSCLKRYNFRYLTVFFVHTLFKTIKLSNSKTDLYTRHAHGRICLCTRVRERVKRREIWEKTKIYLAKSVGMRRTKYIYMYTNVRVPCKTRRKY